MIVTVEILDSVSMSKVYSEMARMKSGWGKIAMSRMTTAGRMPTFAHAL